MANSECSRPRPEKPEHVDCEVCLKEIPASAAHSTEGPEYIYHFCGLECLEKWKAKALDEEGPVDHPKDV